MRCDEDLTLQFGDIIKDTDNRRWVFTGYATNTIGMEAMFTRELEKGESAQSVYTYRCAMTETAIKKFPALRMFLKQRPAGCPHCGYRHPPDGMCV